MKIQQILKEKETNETKIKSNDTNAEQYYILKLEDKLKVTEEKSVGVF